MKSLLAIALFLFGLSACNADQKAVNPTMEEIAIGKMAPDFSAVAEDGKTYKLSDFKGKYVVLEWLNFGCPFVKKHYNEVAKNMQNLQKKYTDKGVIWLSINSSAKGKQGHLDAQTVKEEMSKYSSNATHILLDGEGDIGRLYGAKTTPHMYVIAPSGEVIYRGAIDDQPSTELSSLEGAKNFVHKALDAHMHNEKILITQTRAYGCSIKY